MKKNRVLTVIVALIGICLMIVGINRKEFEAYWQKAINICTQCVGIG